MARYDMWIHGLAAVPERPSFIVREHRGWAGDIERMGRFFEQRDSHNWFHLPIPTPTIADDEGRVALRYVVFRRTRQTARF